MTCFFKLLPLFFQVPQVSVDRKTPGIDIINGPHGSSSSNFNESKFSFRFELFSLFEKLFDENFGYCNFLYLFEN